MTLLFLFLFLWSDPSWHTQTPFIPIATNPRLKTGMDEANSWVSHQQTPVWKLDVPPTLCGYSCPNQVEFDTGDLGMPTTVQTSFSKNLVVDLHTPPMTLLNMKVRCAPECMWCGCCNVAPPNDTFPNNIPPGAPPPHFPKITLPRVESIKLNNIPEGHYLASFQEDNVGI